jgi:alkaline phosphatase
VGLDNYKNTVKNISELAYEHGADIAVVTTDLITGATPAGFLVHNESRSNYAAIEADILALAESGMLDYHKASVGASLTINTKDALKKVTGEGKNFFVMIEDSGMDAHGNVANDVINNMIRFNDSIAYVSQFVILHPDTALIVTADHETGGIVYDSTSTYKFSFTSTEHTNTNVPVYAFGAGVDALAGGPIENIEIARFMAGVYGENNFGQTEAVSQGTVGDVDANGTLDVIDSIVLTRYLAGFTGYESKIWAEFCGIDADSEITVNEAAILSRHLASWKKYSSLPFVE